MSRTRVMAAAAIAVAAALLGGCGARVDVPPPSGELPAETTVTLVYYATGRSLVQEAKVVDATDVYRSTLEELLEAMPEGNEQLAIVQPEAEVRSVSLKGGVLTIDWAAEVLDFEAEPSEERIALAGILRTFGEFPEVDKVRFTVEGKDSGEVAGHDVRAFWGDVSLTGQPWDVLRPPSSQETTSAAP